MALLLLGHMADSVRGSRVTRAEHGELAFINAHGAIFAGVIDANHRLDIGSSLATRKGWPCFATHLLRTK
jgi:hypothetical protein